MSLDLSYQGLSLSRDAKLQLEEGGLFVLCDQPMPVATVVRLLHEGTALSIKVRRVREGAGAGMWLSTLDGGKLPRWLIPFVSDSAFSALCEPEPPPVVVAPSIAPVAKADATPETEATASSKTPDTEGEGGTGAAGEDDEDPKPSAQKKGAPSKKPAKKPRKR